MTQWKFDATIAKTFVEHARCHIPNYDLVIDKSIGVCQHLLKPDASIIDVGCATGETLRRLQTAGFVNLTGVEASQAMLEHCDHNTATILHSNKFPDLAFDGVICNWTLHFVRDKISYLSDIHRNLNDNGVFVLSDKTSLDPIAIHFYHLWKHSNGVSWDDIRAKERSVKDIMYIDMPNWYIDTLTNIGFKNIQIIDASWCFTTFLCFK